MRKSNYTKNLIDRGWVFIKETLRVNHPETFGKKRKPLKIGIREDLFEKYPNVPRIIIRTALNNWTNTLAYQHSFKNFTKRFDLEGNEVSNVKPSHKKITQYRIKRIRKHINKLNKEKEKEEKQNG